MSEVQKDYTKMTVNPAYVFHAFEVGEQVDKIGVPHWANVIMSVQPNLKPFFKVAIVTKGQGYNPITKEFFKIEPYNVLQRFHKDSEQFGMTAIDVVLQAETESSD